MGLGSWNTLLEVILKEHSQKREGGPLFWGWGLGGWHRNTGFTPLCPVFFLPLIHSSRNFFTHRTLIELPHVCQACIKDQPSPYPQVGWAGAAETTVTCNGLNLYWRKSVKTNTVVAKRSGPEVPISALLLTSRVPSGSVLSISVPQFHLL